MREGETISPSRAMKRGAAREDSSHDGNNFRCERDRARMSRASKRKKREESSSRDGIISVARGIVERGGEKEEKRETEGEKKKMEKKRGRRA